MVNLTKKKLVALGVGGALALAVAVPGMAYANDPSPSPSASSSTSSSQNDREAGQAAFAAALAKELGIDQQKVSDALTKVRAQLRAEHGSKSDDQNQADRTAKLKERLDQAVKDGKLTQAEADAIVKAAQAGVLGGGGHGGDRHR
ncbi:hypothetical protein Cs7R123_11930 [Catellatospora sp. TT07R-123]|uniref:hypothetical protein n=1 Tax=Catellatospora sp. TT07R-123 TaxID=2733863 RepID=UPI001B114848|nr:hypothetical protein [Catellatospora sp. TT07R-123]GHJ43851.1 hypothetical protein Cs7R123_11930 [Catellatospora sp. TT07R-123]